MGNGPYDRKTSTPCACCMNAFKWIPVIFITAVIGWSYYAYVIQLCVFAIDSVIEKILFLLFYHIILLLFLWSYWKTIFTPAGKVPPNFRIPEADIERIFRAESQEAQKRILANFARTLPVTNRTLNGSVRFCEKCKIIKPDRAHHCSVCGFCVLKMDHHCPWVNNCVNFSNYKFFVLFLAYALIYCLYVALTSLDNFIQFWRGELNDSGMGRFHILFLFFVALMFAISLVSLFGYHIYLVLTNRTTLEAFRAPIFRVGGPDKNGYNLGRMANFQEVFGDDWQFWLIPTFTSHGDGVEYPVSAHQRTNMANYESMGDTQLRLEQGKPTDKLINITDSTLNNHHYVQHYQPHDHAHEQMTQQQQTLQNQNQEHNVTTAPTNFSQTDAKEIKNGDAENMLTAAVIDVEDINYGNDTGHAAAPVTMTTAKQPATTATTKSTTTIDMYGSNDVHQHV